MHCKFNKNCFEDSQRRYISTIIGWVSCYPDFNEVGVEDYDVFETSTYSKLSFDDQTLLRLNYENSVIGVEQNIGETVVIDINGEKEDEKKIFSPKEAVKYVSKPLSIIVENSLNDGYFIRTIIKWFGSDALKVALDDERVVMGNAGGCGNARNCVLSHLQGNFKSKNLRLYVVWDSDKEYYSQVQTKYDNDIKELNKRSVKYHILEKRALENYMPDEAIKQVSGTLFSDWYNAYSHLSEVQKDYYCIADGFSHYKVDSKNRLPKPIKDFFDDVSDTNWNYLKCGLKIGNFKTEFPKLFENSPFVYKSSLLQRTSKQTNPEELQQIITEIETLL